MRRPRWGALAPESLLPGYTTTGLRRRLAVVAPGDADRALEVLRARAVSRAARPIGRATASGERGARVHLETTLGTERVLDRLAGASLPRIC